MSTYFYDILIEVDPNFGWHKRGDFKWGSVWFVTLIVVLLKEDCEDTKLYLSIYNLD